jgi:hypothetical protein
MKRVGTYVRAGNRTQSRAAFIANMAANFENYEQTGKKTPSDRRTRWKIKERVRASPPIVIHRLSVLPEKVSESTPVLNNKHA